METKPHVNFFGDQTQLDPNYKYEHKEKVLKEAKNYTDEELTLGPQEILINNSNTRRKAQKVNVKELKSILDLDITPEKIYQAFSIEGLVQLIGYGARRLRSSESSEWEPVGNTMLLATKPVQNGMKRVWIDNNGDRYDELPEGHETDSENYARMVVVPAHSRVHFEYLGYEYAIIICGEHDISYFKQYTGISNLSIASLPEYYYSAYEASMVDGKLASFPGVLPLTSKSLDIFRSAARARGSYFECDTYMLQNDIYWLFVTEFCDMNSQAILGDGVTTWTDSAWSAYNGRNPFIPCGTTDSLGSTTGSVNFTLQISEDSSKVFSVPSYRGIENPFGHIWSWTDGVLAISGDQTLELYMCEDPLFFTSSKDSKFSHYVKVADMPLTTNYYVNNVVGHHVPVLGSPIGSATKGCSDYFHAPSNNTGVRGLVVGGGASSGASAGLSYAYVYAAPSYTVAYLGSRLCWFKLP